MVAFMLLLSAEAAAQLKGPKYQKPRDTPSFHIPAPPFHIPAPHIYRAPDRETGRIPHTSGPSDAEQARLEAIWTVCRENRGDTATTIENCTVIVESPWVASRFRAVALSNRAFARMREFSLSRDISLRLSVYDFTDAIDLLPRHPAAFYGRAVALMDQGNVDQAIGDFDQAIKLGNPTAAVFFERGRAHAMRKNFDAALADFSAAL
jgi:tetratricopeptide (TPR) repeat protein